MNNQLDFGDLLEEYIEKSGLSLRRLSERADLPRTTIINWRDGAIKRPRYWQQIVQVAAALELTSEQCDSLLIATDHPPLAALFQMNLIREDAEKLRFWEEQKPQETLSPAPIAAPPPLEPQSTDQRNDLQEMPPIPMNNQLDFGYLLEEYIEKSGLSLRRLSERADVSRTIIVNWRDGLVKRPRHWQDVVQVGRALKLTSDQCDSLLTAAGYPPLVALYQMNLTREDAAKLRFWDTEPDLSDNEFQNTKQSGLVLPIYRDDDPTRFIIELRSALRMGQSDVAKYFKFDRSRVSKYETDVESPPVGYYAGLVYLIAEKMKNDPDVQDKLLREINRAIRRHGWSNFHDWDDLSNTAHAYLASQAEKRQRWQKETHGSKAELSTPRSSVSRSITHMEQAQPTPLRLDMAVPEKVKLHRTFIAAASVRLPESERLRQDALSETNSELALIVWPEGKPSVSLHLEISAVECDIEGPNTHFFLLFEGHDSPIFYFSLKPKIEGEINIVVKLFQDKYVQGSALARTLASSQQVGEVQVQLESSSVPVINFPEQKMPAERLQSKFSTFQAKKNLVATLLMCSAVRDRNMRDKIVDNIPNDIRNHIDRNNTDNVDVMNIVSKVLDYSNGFTHFLEIVRFYEGSTIHMDKVDMLVDNFI